MFHQKITNMKANLENLISAMKKCAEAHNANLLDYSAEDQLCIDSDTVPTVADVRMIASAFFGSADVETDWGFTTLWIHEFKENVCMEQLRMALPYGAVDKFEQWRDGLWEDYYAERISDDSLLEELAEIDEMEKNS